VDAVAVDDADTWLPLECRFSKPWIIKDSSMKSSFSLTIVLIALLAVGCANPQTRFASPDDAVQSLVTAVRADDQTQLKQIFGSESDEILSSGDDVADQQTRERFLAAYDLKHQLVTNTDGTVTLNIGDSDWPMPIPLVKDTNSSQCRRIGRNELDVIQVCQAIVDAQREYAERDPNGDGVREYALKFISDSGKKNGLYWETAEGEAPSPLGPLVGSAVEEGYTAARAQGDDAPRPYHGYYYRILTSQGPSAPGGALSYLVGDKLIGGFAVIAWPADYGNSGIMTFIVNHRQVVYQKDLGDNTDKLARAITSFDPAPDWKKAE
jgi:hypothetical protein